MGRKAAGKTSMHSIIFANYPGMNSVNLIFNKISEGNNGNWLYSGYQWMQVQVHGKF